MGEMGVWVEKSNIVDLPGVVLQRRAGEQEHVLPLERRRVGERLRAAVLQPLRLIKDNLKEQGLRGLGGGVGLGVGGGLKTVGVAERALWAKLISWGCSFYTEK